MKRVIWLGTILALALTGCTAVNAPPGGASLPTAHPTEKLSVYAPATTSSIPVILAASKLDNVQLTLYTSQEQANGLFLRGEVNILVTGLSVGRDMYRNGAPAQLVNSYVSGLSYLVTSGKPVSRLAELKGQEIYLPFKGSPLEEVTAHLAQQAGLKWPDDFRPVYLPFDSSVALLKQGKASAVVLPEPYVSLLDGQPGIFISLSYADEWQKLHPQDSGYPQVGAVVNASWAQAHAAQLTRFNQALAEAITRTQQDPAAAVEAVKASLKFPSHTLLNSLSRTRYHLLTGTELQQAITAYYAAIGKPLDDGNTKFFYLAAQ